VPNSVANTFGAGFLYGGSPYREVQLYIDGLLAGIVEPFPIIFVSAPSPVTRLPHSNVGCRLVGLFQVFGDQ
jgi:hypothetical protein